MLESGFPRTLTYSYAVLVAVNAYSCIVLILMGSQHSALAEVLVDSVYAEPFFSFTQAYYVFH